MITSKGKTKPANDNIGYFTGWMIDGLKAENNNNNAASKVTVHNISDRILPKPFIT